MHTVRHDGERQKAVFVKRLRASRLTNRSEAKKSMLETNGKLLSALYVCLLRYKISIRDNHEVSIYVGYYPGTIDNFYPHTEHNCQIRRKPVRPKHIEDLHRLAQKLQFSWIVVRLASKFFLQSIFLYFLFSTFQPKFECLKPAETAFREQLKQLEQWEHEAETIGDESKRTAALLDAVVLLRSFWKRLSAYCIRK